MTPTPADLAAALETVRRNTQRPPGSPGRSLEYAEYTDACELLARWLVANAGRLRVVRPLEWVDLRDMPYAKCIDGNCYLVWNDSWQSPGNPTAHACGSLADGKAKAQAWYDERLAAALAPAFPAKEGEK